MKSFIFSMVNNSTEVIPLTVFTCGSFFEVNNWNFKIRILNCYFLVRIFSWKTPPLMKKIKRLFSNRAALPSSVNMLFSQTTQGSRMGKQFFFFNPLNLLSLISLLYSSSHAEFSFILYHLVSAEEKKCYLQKVSESKHIQVIDVDYNKEGAFWILIYCLLPGTLHCFHNNATYIKHPVKLKL